LEWTWAWTLRVLKTVRVPSAKLIEDVREIFIETLAEREARIPGVILGNTLGLQVDGIRPGLKGIPVLRSWQGHLDSHIVYCNPVLVNRIMRAIRIWRKRKEKTCFRAIG
jgi:hypothetical protein